MKKSKAGRVPVLESAFELNLPKIIKKCRETSTSQLVLDDGDIRTVVALTETRLATFLGGRAWVVDIVPVSCLEGRSRPLLKCPRAHEGKFQSLYFRAGELACRHCHQLRYRSHLAADCVQRARLQRNKLLRELGGQPGDLIPPRQPGHWRKRYERQAERLGALSAQHYDALIATLVRQQHINPAIDEYGYVAQSLQSI